MAESLWVDDQRPCPEGYAVARTYDDALSMLRRFEYEALYLDHDLGDKAGRTGYDLLVRLSCEGRVPPRVECISWNPDGRLRIEWFMRDIYFRREMESRRASALDEEPKHG